jgi:hypothetical protein
MFIGVILALRVPRPGRESIDESAGRRYCCIVVPQYPFRQENGVADAQNLICISPGASTSAFTCLS